MTKIIKLIYPISFTMVLGSSNAKAKANAMVRGLHTGGGHGTHHGGHGSHHSGYGRHRGSHHGKTGNLLFMQDVAETACPLVDCSGADEALDCNIERPEHLDWTDMTYEEKQEARGKMEATRKEYHQQVLKCACCTDANIEDLMPPQEEGYSMFDRSGHGHGHHHHGDNYGGRDFIQDMIEDECTELKCIDTTEGSIDCNIERLEHPDFTGMTEEEKEVAQSTMKAAWKDHHQQILQCACCTDATIEDLLPGEGGDSDGFGDSLTNSEYGSGGGGRHGKFGSGGKGPGMKIQHILDGHCSKFECPGSENSETTECARLDSTATRVERRRNALNCVCCRDNGVAELQEQNQVEVSVLLASLLTNEADVQTNESPASRKASWSMTALAAVGAVLAAIV